ncbi:MAG TPA: 2-oxoglutarate and iron-dependent oxygenase domain-containing protein [Alphaproteobacteria bacterium]|jgi:isopenicillin N synthase-like dioxygenase|nr:2-oxoglutarate and iron-dependent oxygenase domain-containing protein [Alphaproteobacteria bacterium]
MVIAAPRPAGRDEVPVLDLSRLDRQDGIDALAAELKQACLNLGFFYVANHGVPDALHGGIFDAMRRYFALPLDERMKDLMDTRFKRGFMPHGLSHSPGFDPDLKESFELALDLPLDDPDVEKGRLLHGPNRWPAGHPWLRAVTEPYFHATMALGRRLLGIFAVSLDLDREYFETFCKKPMMHMRLFHYWPQPMTDSDLLFGVRPHSDLGMLTILNQDPIGGLELRRRDGEWVGAPYIPGTFIVNIGDLFRTWTNDVYVSTPHRVINRTGKERYSVPTFFCLDYDTPVSCLPSCLKAGEAPKYPTIRAGEYVESRLSQSYRDPDQLNAA